MAFVYCSKCDWSQDDFWSDRYNPFQYLNEAWSSKLIKYRLDDQLDGHFDSHMLKETGLEGKTWRDFFIHELKRKQRVIGNMHWATEKEFKDDKNKTCPKCGGHEFTMD
jgi:hypothetical protein